MAEKSKSASRHAAWLELYDVQKSRSSRAAPPPERGRPRRITTLKPIHTYLTKADEELLLKWQKRFRRLAGRTLTLGEVGGLLARISEERFNLLAVEENVQSFEALVDILVSGAVRQKSVPQGTGKTESDI